MTMKTFTPVLFCIAVLLLPVLSFSQGYSSGQGYSYYGAPRLGKISGCVYAYWPQCTQDDADKIASSKTERESNASVLRLLHPQPAPNATVTLVDQHARKEVQTDALGNFEFSELPSGRYEIFAEMAAPSSWPGSKRRATSKTQSVVFRGRPVNIAITLRPDIITITGRVTDAKGTPIKGAKVVGTLFDNRDHSIPNEDPLPESSDTSDANGCYALPGWEPTPMHHLAVFLIGITDNERALETVDVRVQCEGFSQGEQTVALVTDTLLASARRMGSALLKLPKDAWIGGMPFPEPGHEENRIRSYHSGKGDDMIVGLDFVLQRAPASASAAVK